MAVQKHQNVFNEINCKMDVIANKRKHETLGNFFNHKRKKGFLSFSFPVCCFIFLFIMGFSVGIIKYANS